MLWSKPLTHFNTSFRFFKVIPDGFMIILGTSFHAINSSGLTFFWLFPSTRFLCLLSYQFRAGKHFSHTLFE
jgi:hypothetical protein